MLKSLAFSPRVPGTAAEPVPSVAEIRSMRDACGWTREETADALGVLPLEVQAWEAGTVALTGDHLRWLRWHATNAALDQALQQAGAQPCPWIVANREALAQVADAGGAWSARLDLREHRRACAACWRVQQLTGEPPAVPDLSPRPGLLGLQARMDSAMDPPPLWQRLLFRGARLAAVLLALILVSGIVGLIRDPAEGLVFPFFVFPMSFVVAAVVGLVHEQVRPWDGEHPVLAGQARVAAALVTGTLVAGAYWGTELLGDMLWVVVPATLLLGWIFGRNNKRMAEESAGS